MLINERRTKLVCTIGPSTSSPEMIEELIRSGMNVVRLNFSHGTHEVHKKNIETIRELSRKLKISIPILMDLQGPKIRVGRMKGEGAKLETHSYVKLTPDDIEGDSEVIPIDYPNLAEDVKPGNTILMDDGLMELRIVKISDGDITARVINGGFLKPRKGVNLPDVKTSISAITEKDEKDLAFGLEQGVDFVAISFVRSAGDVQDLISKVRVKGSNAGIIAKIEKPEALDEIDDIIQQADGIMVARGDLGIEIASERVPLIQKDIIDRCKTAGKPVITATQMLESMMNNPRPTRAESSDVANAVLDGTDAVMLSGETAAGKYPLEAVRTIDKICRNIEVKTDSIYQTLEFVQPEWREKQVVESLSYACVTVGEAVEARLIATITHSGTTARRIAKFRPRVPVIAFTESVEVRRQLNLVWGVTSIQLDALFDTDTSVKRMEDYLKESGLITSGSRIVVAAGIPISKRGSTNMVKVSTIE
ncbi:pyruvate kinase [Natronogracilivirga saccharolytica]|uniref:Pyruvate kinase n=1 Tax=Natronogracilivirga saccharolytica TaxID=2812953 RepID=A0A8J7S8B2_9BACT|nr:pyruvate kinase [Natronogracilivirga saccharolytica]MBP3193813.1 pyruvate kinase [Natronogracilivirga saccharolytica]